MKRIFRLLGIFFIFFTFSLYGSVSLNSSKYFIKGEPFIFEFEVKGSSLDFPKIEKIDKYLVQELGTSRSLQIINGSYSEKISKKYQILPESDFTIPSFEFEIDGSKFKSEQKEIKEKKAVETISNDFSLKLVSSKKNVYVGEEIPLKLIFKYKKNLQVTNLDLQKPHFENFWYEGINNKNNRYEENGFIVQELNYLLFAQKSGSLKVNPLNVSVQISKRDSDFGSFSIFSVPTEKKIYSNSLEFNVKKLPENINLIGNFDIKAKLDKNQVEKGQAVSLKIEVEGIGNIDDIKDISLDIENATIYENKAKITKEYKNDELSGKYEKVFSIIPNSNIKIPSIKLNYFNKEEHKVITKNTTDFFVEVLENRVRKEAKLEKAVEVRNQDKKIVYKEENSIKNKIIFFLLGVLFSILIICLFFYVKVLKNKKEKKETSLLKKIKKVSKKEDLLKLLLPYLRYDEELDKLIFECEKTKDFKKLKKEIEKVIKKLDIQG